MVRNVERNTNGLYRSRTYRRRRTLPDYGKDNVSYGSRSVSCFVCAGFYRKMERLHNGFDDDAVVSRFVVCVAFVSMGYDFHRKLAYGSDSRGDVRRFAVYSFVRLFPAVVDGKSHNGRFESVTLSHGRRLKNMKGESN